MITSILSPPSNHSPDQAWNGMEGTPQTSKHHQPERSAMKSYGNFFGTDL